LHKARLALARAIDSFFRRWTTHGTNRRRRRRALARKALFVVVYAGAVRTTGVASGIGAVQDAFARERGRCKAGLTCDSSTRTAFAIYFICNIFVLETCSREETHVFL